MKKVLLSFVLGVLFFGTINAQEKTDKKWQARLRGVAVMPNASATIGTIGGDVEIGDRFIPELDFTYFFTENIAVELILGTAKHDVKAVKTALGNVDLGSVWLLPPTLSLQYHFNLEKFRPYVGASANYTFFYNENPGAVVGVDYKDSFGYGGQLGFDYDLDDTFFINVDAKYLLLSTDVSVDAGTAVVPADVDINPLLIGFGVGMRF